MSTMVGEVQTLSSTVPGKRGNAKMNSQTLLLFSTPVWLFKAVTDDASMNQSLAQAILAERQREPTGVHISNQNGWQSRDRHLESSEDYKKLVDIIDMQLMQVGKYYGFGKNSSRLKIANMWANINQNGSFNSVHSHNSIAGAVNPLVLSGTYYVKVPPNSGGLVISDHFRPLRFLLPPFEEKNLTNCTMLTLKPDEGDLFIFPSWAEHSVEVNKSGEDRLSIAFNIAMMMDEQAIQGGSS